MFKIRILKLSRILLLLVSTSLSLQAQHALLETQTWIHGSDNCSTQNDSLVQVVRYDVNTWILRQNKCIHYEAPFMYLFVGAERALLVDTGATQDETKFPLYTTVRKILGQSSGKSSSDLPLVVIHSHGHLDHWAGDTQFRGRTHVTVIGLTADEVQKATGIASWPEEEGKIDLGSRTLDIIPIPGHQKASIALYDHSTHLLLTGDTFYPGHLYVDDWEAFKKSISRLTEFAHKNTISYILGNHIEMSTTPGVDYPTGSTSHPHEQMLPLSVVDLETLHSALETIGDKPVRKVFDKYIVVPK